MFRYPESFPEHLQKIVILFFRMGLFQLKNFTGNFHWQRGKRSLYAHHVRIVHDQMLFMEQFAWNF